MTLTRLVQVASSNSYSLLCLRGGAAPCGTGADPAMEFYVWPDTPYHEQFKLPCPYVCCARCWSRHIFAPCTFICRARPQFPKRVMRSSSFSEECHEFEVGCGGFNCDEENCSGVPCLCNSFNTPPGSPQHHGWPRSPSPDYVPGND